MSDHLLRDPETGHLAGIEQKPVFPATVEATDDDRRARDEHLARRDRRIRWTVLRDRFNAVPFDDIDDGFLDQVEGLLSPPLDQAQYPRWVEPHGSHVIRHDDGRVTVPAYGDVHVDRSGKPTVLVHSEEDEKRATSQAEERPDDLGANEASLGNVGSDPNIPRYPNPETNTQRNLSDGDPDRLPPTEDAQKGIEVEDAEYRPKHDDRPDQPVSAGPDYGADLPTGKTGDEAQGSYRPDLDQPVENRDRAPDAGKTAVAHERRSAGRSITDMDETA